MTRMKEKIKNFFGFIAHAWTGGPRGKWGLMLVILALFMFIRMFSGDRNVQRFVINAWNLNHDQAELAEQKKILNTLEHHLELLRNGSPDYIQELGLQYLNLGDGKFKILKI
ncbi:MAG: hypothetical protein J6S74_01060 [Alphaproteobacteria bacterium]|nr:hypothetical protein [Alphaproteobacteria bacterium]